MEGGGKFSGFLYIVPAVPNGCSEGVPDLLHLCPFCLRLLEIRPYVKEEPALSKLVEAVVEFEDNVIGGYHHVETDRLCVYRFVAQQAVADRATVNIAEVASCLYVEFHRDDHFSFIMWRCS